MRLSLSDLVMLILASTIAHAQPQQQQSTADDLSVICPSPATSLSLARSTCSGYVNCESRLCACTDGTYATADLTCSFGAPTCNQTQQCVTDYVQCIKTLVVTATQVRTDCSAWAYRAYTDLLAAMTGNPLTELQQSCEWQVCVIRNLTNTLPWRCPAINASAMCDFTKVGDAFTPTPAPPTNAPYFPYVFIGQLALNGSWTNITQRPGMPSLWQQAAITDLAVYFNVSTSQIGIARYAKNGQTWDTVITSTSISFSVSVSDTTSYTPFTAESKFRGLLPAPVTWLNATKGLFELAGLDPRAVFVLSVATDTMNTPQPPPPPCGGCCYCGGVSNVASLSVLSFASLALMAW